MQSILLAVASFLEHIAAQLRSFASETNTSYPRISDELQTEMMGVDPHMVEVLKER